MSVGVCAVEYTVLMVYYSDCVLNTKSRASDLLLKEAVSVSGYGGVDSASRGISPKKPKVFKPEFPLCTSKLYGNGAFYCIATDLSSCYTMVLCASA